MIGVIVPVYNVERYLDRCVESILSQTYADFKLFLIDDGSTDHSGALCLAWQAKDRRITYIRKANEGLGPTRNLGIQMTEEPYLCFIDSDDWIAPDYLSLLYEAIEREDADIAVCDWYNAYENGMLQPERATAWYADLSKKCHPHWGSCQNSMWNKLFRRALFDRTPARMPACYCEDLAYFPHLVAVSRQVALVRKPLYYYWRSNATSITSGKVRASDMLQAAAYAYPAFADSREAYWCMAYHFHSFALMTQAGNPRQEADAHTLARELLHQLDPALCAQERTALCFGSFNLRRLSGYALGNPGYLRDYSCSSLISMAAQEPSLLLKDHPNWYRKRMLSQDLQKSFTRHADAWQSCDIAIIDLLEERLGTVDTGDGTLTLSDGFLDLWPGDFPAHWQRLDCLDPDFLPRWQTACAWFSAQLADTFPPERILIIRNRLMTQYGDYGPAKPFQNQERIQAVNVQLDSLYNYLIACLPGATVLDPAIQCPEYCYTDQGHAFGCHPWHSNEYLYQHMALSLLERLEGFPSATECP